MSRRLVSRAFSGVLVAAAMLSMHETSRSYTTRALESLAINFDLRKWDVKSKNSVSTRHQSSRNNIQGVSYPNTTGLVYYVPARGQRDRSGAAIIDMLKAQAYSFSKGVLFGGACGETPHRKKNEEMIEILGLDPILKYACPPDNVANEDDTGTKHEIITRNVFFENAEKYFTDDWLDYVHSQVQPFSKRWLQTFINENSNQEIMDRNLTNKSQYQNYTIVMHIRRGDVDPCGHWSFRYLPNSHYIGMFDFYNRRAPKNQPTQCLVFSESHSLVESFEDFSSRGCQVVLDGDPTLAWKAMLDADVLIMSLSSFSAVPALLNKHGIIAYTPLLGEPLRSNWRWHVYKHSNQAWRNWIRLCDETHR